MVKMSVLLTVNKLQIKLLKFNLNKGLWTYGYLVSNQYKEKKRQAVVWATAQAHVMQKAETVIAIVVGDWEWVEVERDKGVFEWFCNI